MLDFQSAEEYFEYHMLGNYPARIRDAPHRSRPGLQRQFDKRANKYNVDTHEGKLVLFKKTGDDANKVVLLSHDIPRVLKDCHYTAQGGHRNKIDTINQVKATYLCPNVGKIVSQWWVNCAECNKKIGDDQACGSTNAELGESSTAPRSDSVQSEAAKYEERLEHCRAFRHAMEVAQCDNANRRATAQVQPVPTEPAALLDSSFEDEIFEDAPEVVFTARQSSMVTRQVQREREMAALVAGFPSPQSPPPSSGQKECSAMEMTPKSSIAVPSDGPRRPEKCKSCEKLRSAVSPPLVFDKPVVCSSDDFAPARRTGDRFWMRSLGPIRRSWSGAEYLFYFMDERTHVMSGTPEQNSSLESHADAIARHVRRYPSRSQKEIVVPHELTEGEVAELIVLVQSRLDGDVVPIIRQGPVDHEMLTVCDKFEQFLRRTFIVNTVERRVPTNWHLYMPHIFTSVNYDDILRDEPFSSTVILSLEVREEIAAVPLPVHPNPLHGVSDRLEDADGTPPGMGFWSAAPFDEID